MGYISKIYTIMIPSIPDESLPDPTLLIPVALDLRKRGPASNPQLPNKNHVMIKISHRLMIFSRIRIANSLAGRYVLEHPPYTGELAKPIW